MGIESLDLSLGYERMDLLNSWLDAGKKLAQNALKEKIDAASVLSGQMLLQILKETFLALPPEKRQLLFQDLQSMLAQLQGQPKEPPEPLLQQLMGHPVIREMAGQVTQRLLKTIINRSGS